MRPFALLLMLGVLPCAAGIYVEGWYGVQLCEFGSWVWLAGVGTVWVPRVDPHWQPYLCGHWAWSPWGWMWISHDPWGSYPYHYGRWMWTRRWGWVWVPGRVWAPAWVFWVSGPGWVAWAPLPPEGCAPAWDPPCARGPVHWVVVRDHDFLSPSLSQVRLSPREVGPDLAKAWAGTPSPRVKPSPPPRPLVERASGRVAVEVRGPRDVAVPLERPAREGRASSQVGKERKSPLWTPEPDRAREPAGRRDEAPARKQASWSRGRDEDNVRHPRVPPSRPSGPVRGPDPGAGRVGRTKRP